MSSSKKRQSSHRERDRTKIVGSTESGGSSQCDTPPLVEKEGHSSHGKYAGISSESIQCMAEQVGVDINPEAVVNLAEDASYKLRQVMHTIALHSELMKKTTIDSTDVNTVLRLMDTSSVVGSTAPHYAGFGDEKLCHQIDYLVNIPEAATMVQSFVYTDTPTLSVEWITDDKSLTANHTISASLHNYYTNVARAILNLKRKLKDIAVQDLMRNTRIGPIFPNLFNLAVLVLNDDNLNALNVPIKKPLQANVLDMVDALCSNPCSLDTNITQQFQRLFPVMVSNILGNGTLSEKMVQILTKITRTWPSFVTIGMGILVEYLAQGTEERLTAAMVRCILALGRRALLACLSDRLDYLDEVINAPRTNHKQTDLRETLLDACTCLMRPDAATFLEDYVTIDYTFYEMIGDSILPRRLLAPPTRPKNSELESQNNEDDSLIAPIRPVRRGRFRLLPPSSPRLFPPRDLVFEPVKFSVNRINCRVKFKVPGLRNLQVKSERITSTGLLPRGRSKQNVVVASGLLNRFRYRLNKSTDFPIFGFYTL